MRLFHRFLFLGCILLGGLGAAPAPTVATPTIDPERYLNHIKYLASPEMRGRATGSPELEKAADYIAGQFRAIGLKPLDANGYFQAFPVTTNARLGHDNHFEFVEGGKKFKLKPVTRSFRSTSHRAGRLRQASCLPATESPAPEYNYDDYAGLDVKDKMVLILRHEPQEFDEKSVFAGKVYTEHAQFFSKATNAKMHGARGVILINDIVQSPRRSRRSGKIRPHRGTRRRRHSVRADEGRSGGALDRRCGQEPG